MDESSSPTSAQETAPQGESQYALPNLSRIAVLIVVLGTGVIYALLPDRLRIGPSWLLLVLELIAMVPTTVLALVQRPISYTVTHRLVMVILGLVTVGLVIGLALFLITLPSRGQAQASSLLRDAALLYISNILLFGLWYWEVDGGGPRERHLAGHVATDFMFPQQVDGDPGNWAPYLMDYLFVAFTAATALSPTDTYPLTQRAKVLMMIEAVIALTILVVLVGRGVNIL